MASLRHPCYPYSTHVCRREGDDLNLDNDFDLSDDEDEPGGPGGEAFTQVFFSSTSSL